MNKLKNSKFAKHSYYKDLLSTLFRIKNILIPLVIVFIILCLGMLFKFCPYFDYLGEIDLSKAYISPSKEHLFGTNKFGQDMFYLSLISCFNTLCFSFLIFCINVLIGTIIGLLWGYFIKFDLFTIFIKNIMDNIPMTFVYIACVFFLGSKYTSLLFILILFGWIDLACLIRNNLILIRNKSYNLYSKMYKVSTFKQFFHNYLPSLIPIIFNYFAISIPTVISIEVSISYLAFPIDYSSSTLGSIIYSAIYKNNCMMYPYLLIFPLIFLITINLCIFVIGKTISKKAMIGGGKDA